MRENPPELYLPELTESLLTTEKVSRWYANLLIEGSQASYPDWTLPILKDKRNYYGKYFYEETRYFFLNHFARNLAKAINYFFNNNKSPIRFLEIGSGCGNQLLLMAFLGAVVVGCDIRKDVCKVVRIRKKFYEKISSRKLNIAVICEDVFKVNWDEFPKFDAVNFLFSFNDVVPSHGLLELVNRLIKPGGRLVIQDINRSNYFNRLFRRRDVLTPGKLANILKGYGFRIRSLQGGCVLPPILWRMLPRNVLTSLEKILCKSIFLSFSYQLMAEKTATE